jgi:polar amino acid transport system permease protein
MTTGTAAVGTSPASAEPVVKLRHPLRWLLYLVLAVLLAMLINTLVNNPRFGWSTVGHYFTSPEILRGMVKTIELTVIAMVVGIALGVLLAVMRLSHNAALSAVATVYVWLFRGTPIFVQILFWGYISALYPQFSLGVPFGPHFISASVNSLITPFIAAVLGLGLNEGAYMAEIVRAGILSVDFGQTEAAQALGMSRPRIIRRIILPQAMRVIIPPTGNETISMLKTTSLVSVLAFPELLYAAQLIYSTNFKTIPLLITASLWYLLMTTILTIGQFYLERRFSRSDRGPAARTSTWRRMLAMQRRSSAGVLRPPWR